MRLSPQSFNGFTLQQVNRVSSCWSIDYDWTISGIATNSIARSQNFPLFAAKTYAGNVKVISVTMNQVDSDRDALVIAMDILGDSQHVLISTDEFGRAWYVNAVCIGLNEEGTSDNTATFGLVFEIDDPLWKKVISSTETIAADGTGSGTLTTIGNQPALPVITITPISANASGFAYQRFIQVINNSTNALTNYPLNLTGAGLDTSALVADNSNKCQVNQVGGINAAVTTIPYDTVTGTIPSAGLIYVDTEQIQYTGKTGTTAGNLTGCTRGVNGTTAATHADNAVMRVSKMAANGNDVRIYVDGAEVKRWFQDFNTANTKIWINWTQPANSDMTLGAAIAGAGAVSTITIENTPGNVAKMALIPTSGNVLIGSEIFIYTGVNVGALTLTGCTRASRQTSAGAHSIGDAVKFITHDVYMYYNDPNISAYVADDTNKPIIKLTSTNTSHIYEEFKTTAALRTAEWTTFQERTGDFIYTAAQDTDADPATVSGVASDWVSGYGTTGSWNAGWILYNPCGVTTVTATGEKYRQNTTFSSRVTFKKSADGITYTTVWTESSPSAPTTWEALDSHSSVSLSGTYNYLKLNVSQTNRFDENGTIYKTAFSDFTAALDSTKTPTVTLATETGVVSLNSVITNAVTGESMNIQLVMTIGQVLTVDTVEKTITLDDGTNQINALTDMPIRPEWLKLLPSQANAITITEPNVVNFGFEWEDRYL